MSILRRTNKLICSQFLIIIAVIAQDDNLKHDIDDDLNSKGTPPVVMLMLWLIAAGMIFWFYKEVSKIRKDWMSAVFVVDGHSLSGLKRRRYSRRRNDPHSAVGHTSRLSQFEAETRRAMAVSQMRAWQKQEQKESESGTEIIMSDTLRTAATDGSISTVNTSSNHGSITYPFRVITDNLSLFQASAAEAISTRLKGNNGSELSTSDIRRKKKISLSDSMIDGDEIINVEPMTDGTNVLSFEGGSQKNMDESKDDSMQGGTVRTVDEMYENNNGSRFSALLRTAKKTMSGNGDYIEV